MVRTYFRTLIVALACSALVAVPASHCVAQTSIGGGRPSEITTQHAGITYGSQKVLGATKNYQAGSRVLKTAHDYAKAGQTATEANKSMAEREKQLVEPQKLEATLLEEISRSGKIGRKVIQGTKLIHSDMLTMMKDEKTLSRAEKITREGHGTLERGQKIVMTPRL
jgi:hypothetical protein